jgi:uncharacterized protein
MASPSVILDTNTIVAAAFNPQSDSARIVEQIEQGKLRLVWNDATRREARRIVEKIPPLSWPRFAALYSAEGHYTGQTMPEQFGQVRDPDDRKFAALAAVTGATLVTQDDDLLAERDRLGVTVLTPGEFIRQHRDR